MTTFFTSNIPTDYKPKLQTYSRPIYSSPLSVGESSFASSEATLFDRQEGRALRALDRGSMSVAQTAPKVQYGGPPPGGPYKRGTFVNERSTDFFIISKENRIENPTSFYGCFYLGPFEPGQGITIGNALRRTLLSSIPSYAITAVEIEGVSHEYSSIPGVKETVLDLLLALNETVLTSQTSWKDKKNCVGYLKKQGPSIVYARDLRLPPELQCVNPNQYIATLSDNGYLNFKFQIQYGTHWTEMKGQNWYNSMKSEETDSISHDSLLSQRELNANLIEQPWPTLKTDDSFHDSVKENNVFATTKTSLSTKSELKSFLTQTQTTLQKIVNYAEIRENLTRSETLPLLLNPNFSPIRKINYLVESSNINFVHPHPVMSRSSDDQMNELAPADRDQQGSFFSDDELYKNQRNYVELLKTKDSSEIVLLEIWTNGSMHPRTALSKAVQHCATTFSKLGQILF